MNYVAGVEVVKTISGVRKLVVGVNMRSNATTGVHTRPSRSAPECLVMCSIRTPLGIHSEMNWKESEAIPRRGTIF